jgi:hypothetical protein
MKTIGNIIKRLFEGTHAGATPTTPPPAEVKLPDHLARHFAAQDSNMFNHCKRCR